jgi:NAD-dependent deacetylase
MDPAAVRSSDAERVARDIVERSERIVVLSGAGISTDSGIPDFRGPQGVWTKNPGAERLATLQAYLSDPAARRAAWKNRSESAAWTATPNDGHRALVALERSGHLELLVTQNIDGLHQQAGSHPDKVVEIHGTIRDALCLRCGDRQPMQTVLERVRSGEDDPACLGPGCGGILKSATISFGQSLVPEDLRRVREAAAGCDLLLAVGTSLSVYPVAELVPLAVRSGAAFILVNAQPTPFDHLADVTLRRPISEVLPVVVAGATASGSTG